MQQALACESEHGDAMNPYLRSDLRETGIGYTRPHEPTGLVRAHMNEMTCDWPSQEKAVFLQNLAGINLGLYPEQQPSLSARLEARLGAPAGAILLGPSSGALLDLLAIVGLDIGDIVAIPDPGFTLYPLLVRRAQAKVVKVALGTVFPLQGFREAAMAGARQLWITSPNNPTGALADPDALHALCKDIATLKQPPLVVIDEAYVEFAAVTARLLVDQYPFVVLLRTLSKALGSAGLRLGYLIGEPGLVARLALLQLPYSISAPSLCALDVALSSPAPFERIVSQTIERRERLTGALANVTGVAMTSSSANFMYLAPDRSTELAAAGVLARALPGSGAFRVSLADERSAEAVASAYGAKLAQPGPVRKLALLALDVDGVLIDAEESFRTAVARALAELHPALPWNDALFRTMKRVSGMNNDFRLAAALAYLWEASLRNGDTRFADLQASTPPKFEPSESVEISAAEPVFSVCVAKHYSATQSSERPLITHSELTEIWHTSAIYTGRNGHELALAERTLGFTLPAVVDRGAHVRKPAPGGLLQLRDRFRADAILFVGDTADDYAALQAARAELPHVTFAFCAVGPARSEIVPAPDARTLFSFATLRDARGALRAWLAGESS